MVVIGKQHKGKLKICKQSRKTINKNFSFMEVKCNKFSGFRVFRCVTREGSGGQRTREVDGLTGGVTFHFIGQRTSIRKITRIFR